MNNKETKIYLTFFLSIITSTMIIITYSFLHLFIHYLIHLLNHNLLLVYIIIIILLLIHLYTKKYKEKCIIIVCINHLHVFHTLFIVII